MVHTLPPATVSCLLYIVDYLLPHWSALAENRLNSDFFSLGWSEFRFQFSLVRFFVFSLHLMLISVQSATPTGVSAVNKDHDYFKVIN